MIREFHKVKMFINSLMYYALGNSDILKFVDDSRIQVHCIILASVQTLTFYWNVQRLCNILDIKCMYQQIRQL